MVIQITIRKRHIHVFAIILCLLFSVVLVSGFGSTNPPVFGHSQAELLVNSTSIDDNSIATIDIADDAVNDSKVSNNISINNSLISAVAGSTGVTIGTDDISGGNQLRVLGNAEFGGSLIVERSSANADAIFLMRPQSGQSNGWQVIVEGQAGSNEEIRFIKGDTTTPIVMAMDTDGMAIGGCVDPDHDLILGGSGAGCNTGTFSEVDAGEATFTTSSSRTIKENIVPVTEDNILEKVSNVPVYTYDFIDGPKDKMGLVAEDFHTIFGRGSDKRISGQEMIMALWLSVQELTQENQELQAVVCQDHPDAEFCA